MANKKNSAVIHYVHPSPWFSKKTACGMLTKARMGIDPVLYTENPQKVTCVNCIRVIQVEASNVR